METTQIMSNHATYRTYRMLLVSKWDVFDYISAGCPYTVSWCRLIGRWSCWAIGFLMPSHIIPKNNSSVWHSLLQVVHLWKIQNKIQKMLEIYIDAIIWHLFPIRTSAPNPTATCAKEQIEDSETLVRVAQKLPQKSPSTMMIYDDLWSIMIYPRNKNQETERF